METKELKLFTLEYIRIQDNLTPQEKIQLAEFVVKASREQVAFLLTKGYMVEKDNAVLEGFVSTNVGGVTAFAGSTPFGPKGASAIAVQGVISQSDLENLKIGAAIAGLALAAYLIHGYYRLYQDTISKNGRKCKHYGGGKSRAQCLASVRYEAYKKQIQGLNQSKKYCDTKSKHPEKCKAKINQKIGQLTIKMRKEKEKADSLAMQIKATRNS